MLSLHISNIYAKKKGIAKKLILTLRAILISQEVDLVSGDFKGTAWRCRSRNNISTIDEAFTDSTLPTAPGRPPHCGDLDPFLTCGQTSADFSNHRVLIDFGKCMSMVHSPSHGKRLVYVPPIKVAIMKPGFIWTFLSGATLGPSKMCMNNAFLERTTCRMLVRESKKTY